jgi:2',3'-cyclic-nucleotide 2'-phosphodiesterase (5'-nucleotidase family)
MLMHKAVSAFFAIFLCLTTQTAWSGQFADFIAGDDTYVVENFPTDNYGSNTNMYIAGVSAASSFGNERGWMKFNIADRIPAGATITKATLRLYCFSTDDDDDMPASVFGAASDSWDEDSLTWSSQPAVGSALSTTTVLATDVHNFDWYEWDVTSFVQGEFTGDQIVSLMVKADDENQEPWKIYQFNTKEFQDLAFAPRLRIEYSGSYGPAASNLKIIHFNDLHSRLLPHDLDVAEENDVIEFEQVGGAAYLAAKVKELKTANPDALVLDAGDISEGSPIGDLRGNGGTVDFFTALDAELKTLGGRGVDAVVVGNHDMRSKTMMENMRNSTVVKYISVNITNEGTQTPYFDPYVIVNTNGKKIGILGYSTDISTYLGDDNELLVDVVDCVWNDSDPNTINIKDWVDELRDVQGCDLVVFLAHIGHNRIVSRDDALLRDDGETTPPEVVVSGHWHTMTEYAWQANTLNGQTLQVEAASYAQYVGELEITEKGRFVNATKHVIRNAEITPNPAIESFLNTLKLEYNATMPVYNLDDVIGWSDVDLTLDKDKWWTPNEFPWSDDNTSGSWISDAMQWKAIQEGFACDLATQTGGGIRRDIAAGPVTYREIYETYPWQDDNAVRVQMTGQEVWDFIEDSFCGASLTADWNVTAEDGEITQILFQGAPLNLSATFNVVISEYMYDNNSWSDTTPEFLGFSIRDGVIEYTAQFTQASPLPAPNSRYELDTSIAGRFSAVVTGLNDAENQPFFEAVFVRLLSADEQTIERRNSYGLADLVNEDGSINYDHQMSESMLYRSHLGFPDGYLKVGDILEVRAEGGFFSGNPQWVEQHGIWALDTEFNILGHNASLARPELMAHFNDFFDEFHENHLVKIIVQKVDFNSVRDAQGTEITVYKEGGFFTQPLPGADGDFLELIGMQTARDGGRRFRAMEINSAGGYPAVSSVNPVIPTDQTTAPLVLTATAMDIVSNINAGALVAWPTFGEPGNQAFTAPGSEAPNITGFNMVRGAGINPAAASNSMNSNGWDSQAADDYFEFGFNVAAGFNATLDNLIIGTRSSNTGPGTLGLYTSLDSFTNPVHTFVQQGSNFLNSIIDLSGLGTVSGDFRVRIQEIGNTQADGSGSTSGGGTFRIVDHFDSGVFSDTQFTGSVSGGSGGPIGGVQQVEFFYRYSTDGSSWGAWTSIGNATAEPWSISFNYPEGFGRYEFYSIAEDADGFIEDAPVHADAIVNFTSLPPAAPVNNGVADGASISGSTAGLSVLVDDSDSPSLTVSFYDCDDTLLSTSFNVLPGQSATFDWSGLAPGASYCWYVIVDDGAVQTISDQFTFSTSGSDATPVPAMDVRGLALSLLLMLILALAGMHLQRRKA